MRIVWTREAFLDLEEISLYYSEKADDLVADSMCGRIVAQIEKLQDFPERVRASERIEGARELVIHNLPYIAFVSVRSNEIVVLNVVHTARQFPSKS